MVRLPLHGVLRMVRAGDRDRRLYLRHRRLRARHRFRVGLHHLHAARRGLRCTALNLRAVARGDLLPPVQETAPHPRTVRHRRTREFRIPAAQYTLADGRGVPASAPRRARMACPTQAGVPRLMNRALPVALASDPQSYEVKFQLARLLSYTRQREEAIRLYTELLSTRPTNSDLLLARGRTS